MDRLIKTTSVLNIVALLAFSAIGETGMGFLQSSGASYFERRKL